jgi:hypothetical protein
MFPKQPPVLLPDIMPAFGVAYHTGIKTIAFGTADDLTSAISMIWGQKIHHIGNAHGFKV